MTEQFHESDVIFPENYSQDEEKINIFQISLDDHNRYSSRNNNKNLIKGKNNNKKKRSVPVNIPEGDKGIEHIDSDCFDDEDAEMVPPHLVVGRRVYARKVAYSVCTGNGRTLKGRDLREVRTSVLKMTGFLES